MGKEGGKAGRGRGISEMARVGKGNEEGPGGDGGGPGGGGRGEGGSTVEMSMCVWCAGVCDCSLAVCCLSFRNSWAEALWMSLTPRAVARSSSVSYSWWVPFVCRVKKEGGLDVCIVMCVLVPFCGASG